MRRLSSASAAAALATSMRCWAAAGRPRRGGPPGGRRNRRAAGRLGRASMPYARIRAMRALSANPLKRFQRRPMDASQLAPPRVTKRWRSASHAPWKADLRQHGGAGAVGLDAARGRRRGGSGGLRAGPRRLLFQAVERSCREGPGRRAGWSACGRVSSGSAEGIVERGSGDVEVGGALDALLRDGGEVDADGEHVDVGGHAGGADVLGALEVGLGGAEGLLGGLEALGGEDARRSRRGATPAMTCISARRLVLGESASRASSADLDGGARLTGVVDRLVDGELAIGSC